MELDGNMNEIIDRIVNFYGFEIDLLPASKFQYAKRNFYNFIKKINDKLFLFLNKISPIRYNTFRDKNMYGPDGTSWFHKKINDEIYRIEIFPIPPEPAIYSNTKEFKPDVTGNYRVIIHHINDYWFPNGSTLSYFNINKISGIKCLDANLLSALPQLKDIVRDYKLKEIFNE